MIFLPVTLPSRAFDVGLPVKTNLPIGGGVLGMLACASLVFGRGDDHAALGENAREGCGRRWSPPSTTLFVLPNQTVILSERTP